MSSPFWPWATQTHNPGEGAAISQPAPGRPIARRSVTHQAPTDAADERAHRRASVRQQRQRRHDQQEGRRVEPAVSRTPVGRGETAPCCTAMNAVDVERVDRASRKCEPAGGVEGHEVRAEGLAAEASSAVAGSSEQVAEHGHGVHARRRSAGRRAAARRPASAVVGVATLASSRRSSRTKSGTDGPRGSGTRACGNLIGRTRQPKGTPP